MDQDGAHNSKEFAHDCTQGGFSVCAFGDEPVVDVFERPTASNRYHGRHIQGLANPGIAAFAQDRWRARSKRRKSPISASTTAEMAKALWDRFEFVYTPKHGSWLNMAEIELNVLIKQCLDRRIDTITEVQAEATAWENRRNNRKATINWQFTSRDARTKLKRLYPTLNN